MAKKFKLLLKSKACVFIDWANVHGWSRSLGKEVDSEKLFKYLKTYKQVLEIRFYFGADRNKKSKDFLQRVKKIGYKLTTKPVKYIDGRRKCDFDMEVCLEVHEILDRFESFIFFTGDGDFEPLYKFLVKNKKQVIVIYAHGHLGREVWEIKSGVYKKAVDRLGVNLFSKKMPPRFPQGRD